MRLEGWAACFQSSFEARKSAHLRMTAAPDYDKNRSSFSIRAIFAP
jgi:hypothetical protein